MSALSKKYKKIRNELMHQYASWCSPIPLKKTAVQHLIFYPSCKILFNRVKKSANSSSLMYIAEAVAYQQKKSIDEDGGSYKEAKELSKQFGRLVKKASLVEVWKEIGSLDDYFKFTVVRNPYARTLSSFRQKVAWVENGNYREIPGAGQDNINGFRSFVGFLESGGLYHDRHWWPQKYLLAIPLCSFDFVAKTERLSGDFSKALSCAGLDVPASINFAGPHRAEKNSKKKVTYSTLYLDYFYDEDLMRRVYNLYREDFIAFDYEGCDLMAMRMQE